MPDSNRPPLPIHRAQSLFNRINRTKASLTASESRFRLAARLAGEQGFVTTAQLHEDAANEMAAASRLLTEVQG